MKPTKPDLIQLQTNAFRPFLPKEVLLRRITTRMRVGGFVLVEESNILYLRRVFQLNQNSVVVGVDTQKSRYALSLDDKRLAGSVELVSRRHRTIGKWLWLQPGLSSALFLTSLTKALRPPARLPTLPLTTMRLVQSKHGHDVKTLLESSFGHAQLQNPSWEIGAGVFSEGALIAASFAAFTTQKTSDRVGRHAISHSSVTHPNFRRRGIGQLALRRLIKVCSEQGCRELEEHIHLRNMPSWRRALGCGFHYQGMIEPTGPGRDLETPYLRFICQLNS